MDIVETTGSSRAYAGTPAIGVGIVLFLNGKLLLVKRKHEPAAGLWTLPGGLLQAGETLEQAAKREALEETGLEIELDSLIDVIDFIDYDAEGRLKYHYVLIDYLAFATGGILSAGSDVSEVQLVAPVDLDKFALPAITRAFFEKHGARLFA